MKLLHFSPDVFLDRCCSVATFRFCTTVVGYFQQPHVRESLTRHSENDPGVQRAPAFDVEIKPFCASRVSGGAY
ncbi:hypothetical protein Y032_0753g2074 [Ancylostoma ceylanicum]|uniref:Uncharacterized protein n=1 Tax=Ancylostoma ceylanicum TaxID=53326 RepID=A0A016WFC1_9BILA|nr:hypothetical protein Y032_0753g2074 [Ancylostoma ceylanicum]